MQDISADTQKIRPKMDGIFALSFNCGILSSLFR